MTQQEFLTPDVDPRHNVRSWPYISTRDAWSLAMALVHRTSPITSFLQDGVICHREVNHTHR